MNLVIFMHIFRLKFVHFLMTEKAPKYFLLKISLILLNSWTGDANDDVYEKVSLLKIRICIIELWSYKD